MASKASMHTLLWEHYVLVGQFQGRPHRWVGGMLAGGRAGRWRAGWHVLQSGTGLQAPVPSPCCAHASQPVAKP